MFRLLTRAAFFFRKIVAFSLLAVVAQSCATYDPESIAAKISARALFRAADLKGGQFVLRVYYRFGRPGAPLQVYLEGDGQAWVSRTRASRRQSARRRRASC